MYIRNAVASDLEGIVEIYNQSIPHRTATADTEPISVASRLNWYRDRPHTRPLWVAEINGVVAGWLSFQSFYGRPAYCHTAELSIYVDYNYQRQGIGSSLLERAIAESLQLEIKTLLGFIFAHNYPSLKLFAAYGFVTWGHLPQVAELDGIERDLIILGRRINGS
ncbi:N-acetyltransferase family protein [Myxosarcina sp. GI1(2024)]